MKKEWWKVEIRERRNRREEIKTNVLFISVLLAMITAGVITHTIYVIKLLLLSFAFYFMIYELAFRMYVGESLFGIMIFNIKREFKKY